MNTLYNTYSIGGIIMYDDKNHNLHGMKSTPQKKHRNFQQKEVRAPKVDLFETDHSYYLRLSLPGVKKENLDISITEQSILEIKGKVITNLPENIKNIVFQEIYQGPFHRKIKIPKKIDKQSVRFSYNSGILEVYINKI